MRQTLAVGIVLTLLGCACVVTASRGSKTSAANIKLRTFSFSAYSLTAPEEVAIGSGQTELALGNTVVTKSPIKKTKNPNSATLGTVASTCFVNAAPSVTEPVAIYGFWCAGTFKLKDGTITGQGLFEPDVLTNTFSINGGTGKYLGAAGTATVTIIPEVPDGYQQLVGYKVDIVVPELK